MKRPLRFLLCILILPVLIPPAHGLQTAAASAILMEADSGRVLYEHNAHERRYIASITKLMTALVVVDSGRSPDEVVTIPAECVGAEGSSMYLRAGETMKLETLLYGLLLSSGNDAAQAVAVICGGSVEQFVAEMNRRAALLGMEDTTFKNPSGLTEEGHCSTAADMALLACACMRQEEIARIVATRSITLEGRTFTNHNKLLWRYDGCVGMKTGYTERSGRTLISSARRGGMTLVAVTLNDADDWADHTAMLDWGFASFARKQICTAGERFGCVPVGGSFTPLIGVQAARDVAYPLTGQEQLRREVTLALPVRAPLAPGQSAGVVTCYLGDLAVAVCPLVYDRAVRCDLSPRGSLLERILGG